MGDFFAGEGQVASACQCAMSKPVRYIHVGPSKTATTFLQRDVMGAIESSERLPVPEIAVEARPLRFGDLFSLSPEFWRDVVVSDERISGGLVAPQPWIPESIPRHGLPPRPRLHTHSRVDPYAVSSHFQELRRVAAGWGHECVRVRESRRLLRVIRPRPPAQERRYSL